MEKQKELEGGETKPVFVCLNCGLPMTSIQCKVRCLHCGYFEDCSDGMGDHVNIITK